MKKNIFIISTLFLSATGLLATEFRFPKPEFSSEYESPVAQQPLPTAAWMPYLSLGLLLLVLILTGYAVYRWRSRRIQIVLLCFSLAFFGFFRQGCVCAIGSIQNVTAALASPEFALSLPVLGFFILPLVTALFLGRLFCGAACPMGAFQELVMLRPIKVPNTLDRVLRLIPPLYLGLAILFSFCGLGFIICTWDPFIALFRLSGSISMLIAGMAIVILSIFIARPYCRYLCPYGVLLKAAAFFSSRQVTITPDECITCQLCEQACPNDVIIPPRPRKYSEPGFIATRRIQWLLAVTPAIIALGIIAGYLLSKPAMSLDTKTTLLRNIEAGKIKNEAVIAFLATGTPVEDLVIQVEQRQHRLKIGWMLFGAWSGLIIAGSLIAVSRRRSNREFITDRLNCLCCSRCYAYCPKELKINTGTAGVPPANNSGTAGVPPANKPGPQASRLQNTPTTFFAPPISIAAPIASQSKRWHSRGYLPHFDGDQAIQFITFHLYDSVPIKIIDNWKKELNWTEDIATDSQKSLDLRKKIAKYEDSGSGKCYLKNPAIAKIIQDTLLYYDGDKYHLLEWSIMPNHVHVLIQVKHGHSLSTIIHSWKSFTAHQANKTLKRTGSFWNNDYFDRYIRDEKHYWSTVEYIQLNPVKAGLVKFPDHWQWSGSYYKKIKEAGGTPTVSV